jgi:hypothetical protein
VSKPVHADEWHEQDEVCIHFNLDLLTKLYCVGLIVLDEHYAKNCRPRPPRPTDLVVLQ